MSEPTACCCALPGSYCARVDALFTMPGVHVLDVARVADDDDGEQLRLVVQTERSVVGCPCCGQLAVPHGRRDRLLHDVPAFGQPVLLVWRVRRYRCADLGCGQGAFTEDHDLAPPRVKLTQRACWWAISRIRDDTASVAAVARQLGVDWHTVWDSISPLLAELTADPARFDQVSVLGVDEHLWHHAPRTGKGPREMTGIVDLSRRAEHGGRARLLDLVPGRSGAGYADWLKQRGEQFTGGVQVATLDPFRGYANASRDELDDAVAVLDAFHVVRLGLKAMEETRRRVQQEQLGHRGRTNDPLYRIRNTLRAGIDKLSERQLARLEAGLQAGDPHWEVTIAWRCYQQLRSAFPSPSLPEGKRSPPV